MYNESGHAAPNSGIVNGRPIGNFRAYLEVLSKFGRQSLGYYKHRAESDNAYVDVDTDTVYVKRAPVPPTQAEIDAKAAQDYADRIAGYAADEAVSGRITQLIALLALFGLTLPTSMEEATPVIHAAIKANPELNADGLLLLTVYQWLGARLTDGEIFDTSEAMKEVAE